MNLDLISFHDFTMRVLALAFDEKIKVINTGKKRIAGCELWNLIEFERIA